MRSKGSRFTLGVWGLRVCLLDVAQPSATVRNRSQPFATVRNRSQPSARGRYGRAYGKFCKRGHFWRLHMSRCFVLRGRRGTSWHSDVFCNASKVVFRRCVAACVAGAALWMCPSSFCVAGEHFRRVVLRFFCRSYCQLGLRQVATRCKFRGRRGILWDVMKIYGSLARNIDFEVANLEVHKKTCRKTSVLKLESVKIGGSLARNARFDAPTCLVSSLWFSCGLAVSWGEAVKHLSFWKFSKQVVMLFCVASAALCDIPTCWITCQNFFFCGRGNTFALFSQDELQFSWQAQHFGDPCRHFAW